ncbi:hypothetical protein [Catenibacterium faecis]|uniref:Uncharacterized protein n=1 Tax=Catenibacterium faecis TaxID=2764323 RepID=A0ABR7KDU2_9FIRM|nr:hypothetical protein [Catenibacterium faecis]MBC6010897.1 hypothetical protein [Catenibacterium faecis]
MKYTKLNDPNTYSRITPELEEMPIPAHTIFNVAENEEIKRSYVQSRTTTLQELRILLDEEDITIVETIAASKYLTSLQIFEYITLRGLDVKRENLRKHLLKLMKYRVIQESMLLQPGCVKGIMYYELNYLGFLLSKNGIDFHKGIQFTGISKSDDPCRIKRILVGNQIILNLLMSNIVMERFGVMETMRPIVEGSVGNILIRTPVYVRIDQNSVLAYDVVRDTEEGYLKILDKVNRYYQLIHNQDYLISNFHHDIVYPQLIICGESYEHNVKILNLLKDSNVYNDEDPILFTEDLLNLRRSPVSIYELGEDNKQIWYSLPQNN